MSIPALYVQLIIVFVLYILEAIAYWKLFEKMDIPGWKAFVPIYNIYLRYSKTWNTKYFWVAFVLVILRVVLTIFTGSTLKSVGWAIGFAATYIEINSMFRLSKCFNKGIGYAVGLCFLAPFFMMGLGFGNAKYYGNVGNPDKFF